MDWGIPPLPLMVGGSTCENARIRAHRHGRFALLEEEWRVFLTPRSVVSDLICFGLGHVGGKYKIWLFFHSIGSEAFAVVTVNWSLFPADVFRFIM